ncbi:MAG: RsmD family RNA methyltransferase [Planctomycetota bacterium]
MHEQRKSGRGARSQPGSLRIIGGSMRGRSIKYHGAAYTRPMKDSVRENLFNILGKGVKGTLAFDFFAGTGAIALESVSRGAVRVTAVEQSRHAVKYIRESAENLDVADKLSVVGGDAFRLAGKMLAPPLTDTPWLVFLSPPYQMWEDEETLAALNGIIRLTLDNAPPGSILVAETDRRFDVDRLPAGDWDLREYGNVRLCFIEPAMVCGMNL